MPSDTDSGRARPEQRYSNHLEVGFNAVEFLLRFGQAREDDPGSPVLEVVTNPTFAKAFSRTLAEAVQRYEARFGPVADADDKPDTSGD
jgi:hypothetical protein